ncbi:MAG: type I glutamate--ammonia ligase [Phycisphaerae bacterium]|nr:type I glutamate--ammonia ligase [Phycisphaerae bacterium]
MFASAGEALKYLSDRDIAMVDLKVAGVAGQWMHITIPARNFTQQPFEEGIGYDGSSGSGFSTVESGDVAAKPEPATAFLDPFWEKPTISFICNTVTADTKAPLPSDPRTIATQAVAHMERSGVADAAMMGPEFEFYVFDRLEANITPYETVVRIQCGEVEPDGVSPAIRPNRGYLALPPADRLHNVRSEIALILQEMGIAVRYHHHEVGAPGQCEIEVDLAPLVEAADRTMLIKYVVKNVARRHGKIATFMPKPVFGEAGNGMHVHQKLDKGGEPLFYDAKERNYANLSDLALHYIGGLLQHGCALAGLTNPSTNSFKRLEAGHEAPVNLFFSLANRSAAIRVPKYAVKPKDKRIEYRPPDFTCNVYLALAGMLMAGLDGIQSKTDVAAHHFGPFDVDIAKQDEAFLSKIIPLPRSLYDAMEALGRDHEFLLDGEVFSEAFIKNWIDTKRRDETDEIAIYPHPREYHLYMDV